MLVHSTLTNRMTRVWTEGMRSRAEPMYDKEGAPVPDKELGAFATMSLLEPHKMFQNAFSMFQKRADDFAEPVLTEYP